MFKGIKYEKAKQSDQNTELDLDETRNIKEKAIAKEKAKKQKIDEKKFMYNFLGKDFDREKEKEINNKDKDNQLFKLERNNSFDYKEILINCFASLASNDLISFNKLFVTLESKINNITANDRLKNLVSTQKQSHFRTMPHLTSLTNNNNNIFLSKCKYCITNSTQQSLIISSSDNIYLALPRFGSIVPYHFLISSHEHITSSASLSQASNTELRNYMKSITAFNSTKGNSTVFLEYSQRSEKQMHFYIEAIPFKHALLDEVKMFYRKALSESDFDWSENKSLVDTTPHRGNILSYLNENFSFMHVDFNCGGGFLHVVSDDGDSRFDGMFLKEVLGFAVEMTGFEMRAASVADEAEIERCWSEFSEFDWVRFV